MRIISTKRIRKFWEVHQKSEPAFRKWIRTVIKSDWKNFAELREVFPDADQVGALTVFNVGGNKFRLVAAIHFNTGILFVRAVLTHKDYDKGGWKP